MRGALLPVTQIGKKKLNCHRATGNRNKRKNRRSTARKNAATTGGAPCRFRDEARDHKQDNGAASFYGGGLHKSKNHTRKKAMAMKAARESHHRSCSFRGVIFMEVAKVSILSLFAGAP